MKGTIQTMKMARAKVQREMLGDQKGTRSGLGWLHLPAETRLGYHVA